MAITIVDVAFIAIAAGAVYYFGIKPILNKRKMAQRDSDNVFEAPPVPSYHQTTPKVRSAPPARYRRRDGSLYPVDYDGPIDDDAILLDGIEALALIASWTPAMRAARGEDEFFAEFDDENYDYSTFQPPLPIEEEIFEEPEVVVEEEVQAEADDFVDLSEPETVTTESDTVAEEEEKTREPVVTWTPDPEPDTSWDSDDSDSGTSDD